MLPIQLLPIVPSLKDISISIYGQYSNVLNAETIGLFKVTLLTDKFLAKGFFKLISF